MTQRIGHKIKADRKRSKRVNTMLRKADKQNAKAIIKRVKKYRKSHTRGK